MNTKVWIPLTSLAPRWVEFTDTKGVLRCLKPDEDALRARGIIFLCPKCKSDKQKKHHHIFLFPDAPVEARPHGRFVLCQMEHKKKLSEIKSFEDVTLYERQASGHGSTIIQPRDVCGWIGMLIHGKVYQ